MAASRFLPLIRSESSSSVERTPIIIAPMVCASELAFRLQCRRRSNARLCFTPMTHARMFSESEKYRNELFNTCAEDRPLIVQFCGNDPDILLRAAKFVEHRCDGIDLNLGCPQGIAKKGKYGSFLLEQTELLCQIVRTLSAGLSIPVSCKIRIVPGPLERTIELCQKLELAGCEMITLHGRTREQNKERIGPVNWEIVRQVKSALKIPVLANGGIENWRDAERCILETGVDGVMTCEAVLENPCLFGPVQLDPFEVSLEYLRLATEFPDGGQPKPARGHLFRFLHSALQEHHEFYAKLGSARGLEGLKAVVEELQALHDPNSLLCCPKGGECAKFGPWYRRHQDRKVLPGVEEGSKKLKPTCEEEAGESCCS